MNADGPQALPLAPKERPRPESLRRVSYAFNRFANDNPTMYDAMFTRATRLRFAAPNTVGRHWMPGSLNCRGTPEYEMLGLDSTVRCRT
jgi:hypothetical protein